MTAEERERVARVGYEVWRRTSSTLRAPWEYLRDHERYPWRMAASGYTAQDVWETRYAGYALPAWSSVGTVVRLRWMKIALVMKRERKQIVRETTARRPWAIPPTACIHSDDPIETEEERRQRLAAVPIPDELRAIVARLEDKRGAA